jgi:hypothetical protein
VKVAVQAVQEWAREQVWLFVLMEARDRDLSDERQDRAGYRDSVNTRRTGAQDRQDDRVWSHPVLVASDSRGNRRSSVVSSRDDSEGKRASTMRRIDSVALTGVLLVTLNACGGGGSSTPTAPAQPAATPIHAAVTSNFFSSQPLLS